jgi:hypothetical protein
MPGFKSETANYKLKKPSDLTLALFMAGILANHPYYPFAPDYLAVTANLFD